MINGKAINLIGRRFGRLTVVEYSGIRKRDRRALWKCVCDCGNYKIAPSDLLRSGRITSCGCRKKDGVHISHGKSKTRLYRIWKGMKSRCYNSNQKPYKHYGGRGIVICEEWRNNFQAFYEWALENGYQDVLSIDRIDNDGNYCPDNCRWATQKEQVHNSRKMLKK